MKVILVTKNVPVEKIYPYTFTLVIDDNNWLDPKDAVINIDKPWPLFYLQNKGKLNYTMSEPSEEDLLEAILEQ